MLPSLFLPGLWVKRAWFYVNRLGTHSGKIIAFLFLWGLFSFMKGPHPAKSE